MSPNATSLMLRHIRGMRQWAVPMPTRALRHYDWRLLSDRLNLGLGANPEGSSPPDEPAEVDSYNQPLTPAGIQQATGKAEDAGKLASPRQVEARECHEKMKIIAGKMEQLMPCRGILCTLSFCRDRPNMT